MKIGNAGILNVFEPMGVGTRVMKPVEFGEVLAAAVEKTDFAKQPVAGQAFIKLPASANELVSAGVGRRSDKPEHYVARVWRGDVDLFLKREHAAAVESVAAVVYTREAYLGDPEVKADEAEVARIAADPDISHVLVAVLAFAGPKAPQSPSRWLAALAGGNNQFAWLTSKGGIAPSSANQYRAKIDIAWADRVAKLPEEAKEILAYHKEWATVAD